MTADKKDMFSNCLVTLLHCFCCNDSLMALNQGKRHFFLVVLVEWCTENKGFSI